MTKEQMQVQMKELEAEIGHMAEVSAKLAAFIHGPDFKVLSDLEATMAVSQHHQIAAYVRTLTVRAALLGGRINDPDGDRPFSNDETPNPIITKLEPGEIVTGSGVAVGNTIIQEG